MSRQLISLVFALALGGQAAFAQDDATPQPEQFFIQVEARTSLAGAQSSVRQFSQRLQNVNGFSLGGGWYGVAVGPFASRGEAEAYLGELARNGAIPGDSYIETSRVYGRQFWPVGAQAGVTDEATEDDVVEAQADAPDATDAPAPEAAQAEQPPVDQPVTETTQAEIEDALPEDNTAVAVSEAPERRPPDLLDESPRDARASERQLTREERDALQIALQWAGYYEGRIDGAFGPGTRRSMAGWQEANGIEPTGILTTNQRAELLRQYNAVLDGLGMTDHVDNRAGIVMQMPMDVLDFDRYESPFAIYDAATDLGARVLLISQPGTTDTLNGLYEIMQTLEIVPVEGERRRDSRGFLLTGENSKIVSHTEVGLQNGEIKGFTLIWPAGDEERRSRVLKLMQDSYQRIPGVLDPATVTDDGQAVDLVSGLKVRTAKATASGFFIEPSGTVLTSAETVTQCERVTLNGSYDAQVLAVDADLGVAVLRPSESLAPRRIANFTAETQRLQSEVAVAGYSFGGVLTAPTLTFGTLEDMQGLSGEEDMKRLALAALPGDVGGPVFDAGGSVMGMLLPRQTPGGRMLPDEVSFAAKGDLILDFLRANGVSPVAGNGGGVMAPEDLTTLAGEMTVLVSCW